MAIPFRTLLTFSLCGPLCLGHAASYDLSRDLNLATNPCGVWSVGAATNLGGEVTSLASYVTASTDNRVVIQSRQPAGAGLPAVQHNGTSNTAISAYGQAILPPGTTWFYAGADGAPLNYGVIRFTAPVGGATNYRLESWVAPVANGSWQGDTDFHVMRGDNELFGRFLAPQETTGFTNQLSLAAGDTIDFVIGRGRDGSVSGSGLRLGVLISPTNEVASTNGVAPTVVEPPTSLTRMAGSEANFSVVAEGAPPLTYQWWHNGQAVSGAEATNLVLGNVQPTQAGDYWVVVANAFGSATSAVASLIITNPPAPTGFDVAADFRLNANPNGSWSYGYSEVLGGTFHPTGCTAVGVTDNGVPVQSRHFCDVGIPAVFHNGTTNTAVSAYGQASLPPGTTWFYPGLTGRPENFGVIRFAVPVGGAGTYRVEAALAPVADGPWQGDTDFHLVKNGASLFDQFLGVTDHLTYTNVLSLAEGDTVDFVVGRGTDGRSDGSGLRIQALLSLASTNPTSPAILVPPQSQTVREGAEVSLVVMAEGTAPLGYQWWFNSQELAGATGTCLTLSNVQPAQAGEYRVVVANAFGSVTSAMATLTISNPPPREGFDLAADFRLGANPNGPWSYGYSEVLAGTFHPTECTAVGVTDNGVPVQSRHFCGVGIPAVFHNGTTNTAISAYGQASLPPGSTWFYPGLTGRPENFGVIRFTVPAGQAGAYRLALALAPVADGPWQGDTDFHIVKNGLSLFDQFLGVTDPTAYTNVLNLAEGDTVDFVIGRGADGLSDGSGLRIQAVLSLGSTNPTSPAILVPPQSQTVREGAEASLAVVAEGTAPLGYQWWFNGQEVEGGTRTILTLSNVQPAQAGDYWVVVANAHGSVTSAVASLTVSNPPVRHEFDLGADFSLASNPNGTWSYGYSEVLGGVFHPTECTAIGVTDNGVPVQSRHFCGVGIPAVFHNGTTNTAISAYGQASLPPGTTWFYPGLTGRSQNYGVIRFTVPANQAGAYRVALALAPVADGPWQGDTDFHVLRSGVSLFDQFLGVTDHTAYTNVLNLAEGDTLDFVIGRGADGFSDGSGLRIQALLSLANTNPAAPEILVSPASEVVRTGSGVNLSVVADGTAPLTYQWWFNSQPVEGAVGAGFSFSNVQPAQAGDYWVVVANGLGSATSAVATLTVSNPPVRQEYDLALDFALQPSAESAWSYGYSEDLGGTFRRLECTAEPATDNGVIIQSRHLCSVGLPAVQHNGSTQTAVSAYGQAILPAGTTWFYPGATGRPENFGIVRFTVPSAGAGEYHLQVAVAPVADGPWQGDTDFHVLKSGVSLFDQFLGASEQAGYTNVLTLAEGETVDLVVGRGSDGSSDGSGLRLQATLSLADTNPTQPNFLMQPRSQSLEAGATLSLVVGVNGTKPLSYQWYFAGQSMEGATGASLTVTNVQAAQAGDYWVVVANSLGSATSALARLTVDTNLLTPTFLTLPRNRSALPGQSVSLTVSATGSKPLYYQWYRNGAEVPGAVLNTLSFTNVQLADAGAYAVTVANQAGTVTSPAVVLNVNSATGGTVFFMNSFGTNVAPVFDVDETSKLEGPAFLAQLYAGATENDLQPVGAAVPFRSGSQAGTFNGGTRAIPSVAVGESAYAQVRVWETAAGPSFEAASAAHGKVGWSSVLSVETGGVSGMAPKMPGYLEGLESFALHVASPPAAKSVRAVVRTDPALVRGHLTAPTRLGTGQFQFSLRGQVGVNYTVEVSTNLVQWTPLTNLNNSTGTTPVIDSKAGNHRHRFYRLRLGE